MTEKLKCPICGKDLIEIEFGRRWFFACDNSKCRCKGVASYIVWEHIDRTHKALDVAKKALQELKDVIACPPDISYETGVSMYADGALQEITALEQKDEK